MSSDAQDKRVTVRVQFRGEWSYCQDVSMTKADYDRYDAALDGDRREQRRAMAEISGLYVNPRDIEFEDADDLDDFCLIDDEEDE